MKQILAILILLLSVPVLNAQDVITLRSGDTIKAKVAEVGTGEIRYYKSDNPDGPLYVVNKSEVAQIVYANGTKDVFPNEGNRPQTAPQTVIVERRLRRYPPPYPLYMPFPYIVPHIDLGHIGLGYYGGHYGGHYGGGHYGGGHYGGGHHGGGHH